MELSKRLQAVADLLDYHESVADIGCDHGFVSIYLIESKKAFRCLAMDVNEGPLERATEHVMEKRLSTYIETRLSDGAKAIRFQTNEDGMKQLEVEAALIAGMGGRLIIKILMDSYEKFRCMEEFVLQPQSEIAKVRQFIRENGYEIAKENMIFEEGKFYPMMKVVKVSVSNEKAGTNEVKNYVISESEKGFDESVKDKTAGNIQDVFDEYGEYLLKTKHPVLLQFLEKERELYRDILDNLKKQNSPKSIQRQKEIEDKLKCIYLGLEYFD